MLRLRDRQSVGEIEQKSQDIIDQVLHLHEYVRARGIACYVNKDSEVNTRPLIRAALDQEKRVLIPVVKKGDIELFFSEIKDLGSELAPGTFGILEPRPSWINSEYPMRRRSCLAIGITRNLTSMLRLRRLMCLSRSRVSPRVSRALWHHCQRSLLSGSRFREN